MVRSRTDPMLRVLCPGDFSIWVNDETRVSRSGETEDREDGRIHKGWGERSEGERGEGEERGSEKVRSVSHTNRLESIPRYGRRLD